MADCMTFPDTVEEFMEQYKITDTKQIYTNGAELVPVFRMEQWFEHQTDRMKFVQEAVNTLMNISKTNSVKDKCFRNAARFVQNAIDGEPQDFERIPDEPGHKTCKGCVHLPQRYKFPCTSCARNTLLLDRWEEGEQE